MAERCSLDTPLRVGKSIFAFVVSDTIDDVYIDLFTIDMSDVLICESPDAEDLSDIS